MSLSFKASLVLIAAAVAALPSSALADQRTDARRRFRSGMDAIARSDYAFGIAELQQAYEIKPHPNVLYNIAKAYEDWGKPDAAIAWYTRYLEFDVPDRDRVEDSLSQLRKEVVRGTEPAPAPAPLKSSEGQSPVA